jgi:hypothetical protein
MKQTFHGSSTEEAQAAIEPFQERFIKMCGLPFCFDHRSSMYQACSFLNKLAPSYEDAAYYMAYYSVMTRAEQITMAKELIFLRPPTSHRKPYLLRIGTNGMPFSVCCVIFMNILCLNDPAWSSLINNPLPWPNYHGNIGNNHHLKGYPLEDCQEDLMEYLKEIEQQGVPCNTVHS